jgi:hypothetical protein
MPRSTVARDAWEETVGLGVRGVLALLNFDLSDDANAAEVYSYRRDVDWSARKSHGDGVFNASQWQHL